MVSSPAPSQPARLQSWRLRGPRPSPEVKALTALLCGASACLAVGVAFPMSDRTPRGLGLVMLGVAIGLAGLTLGLGGRARRGVLLGESALIAILNTVLVARAHTTGGAVVDAFAYIWLTVYVAVFFPAWWAPFAALVTISFGAGLLISGLAGLVAAWIVFSLSVMTIAGVVARVSSMLLGRATTDELTGALNRRGLEAAAKQIEARRRSSDRDRTSVAILDLDGFKAINDAHGHASGDRLLLDAVRAWQRTLRGTDILARAGGDEFVLLMPGSGREDATDVLGRLRAAHPVGWSAGLADWMRGEPLRACLERADRELYLVKHGR